MGITSKGARRTLASVCSTAVVLAGASFFVAAPAHAATLALTGSTSVTTLDLGARLAATVAQTFSNGAGGVDGIAATSGTTTLTVTHVADAARPTAASIIGRGITGTGIPNGTVVAGYSDVHNAGDDNDLTLTLSHATSATINNTNVVLSASGTVAAALGASTYAIRETATVSSPLRLRLLTAPSDTAKLYVHQSATTTGVPAATSAWAPVSTATTTGSNRTNDLGIGGANNQLFLTSDAAGVYTFEFYEDVDDDGTPSAGDNVSSVVSLTALHIVKSATGGSTWTPAVTAPTSIPVRSDFPVTVDLGDLTLADSRGTSAIPAALAHLIYFKSTSTNTSGTLTVKTASGGGSVDGTYSISEASTGGAASRADYLDSNGVNDTGSVAVRAAFDLDDGGTIDDGTADYLFGGTATTTASASVASTATVSAVPVSGTVATSSTDATAVSIKKGTSTVKYKIAAASGTYKVTLTPNIHASTSSTTCSTTKPTVTADGTLVSSDTSTGVKVYTVATNASSLAYLNVTSTDTTGECAYYAIASSNSLTSNYVTPAPAALAIANTSTDLAPAVGASSVVLKAKLTDQFGLATAPLASKSQQLQISVGSTTAFASLGSDNIYSYTYTPATAPTAASTTNFTWSYTPTSGSSTGVLTTPGKISWTTATAAAKVTLSTPIDGAGNVALSKSGTINVGQTDYPIRSSSDIDGLPATATGFGDVNGQVIGTVYDASGAVLANKKVTLSGSDGVFFSSVSNGTDTLTKTFDVVTNASGAFSGVYAYFTKSGTATVTAKSDDQSDVQTVTVADSVDPYKVTLNDGFGAAGSAVTVHGTVTDAFGNPVPAQQVSVSVSPSGSGTLSGQAAAPFDTSSWVTDANGVFAVTYKPATGSKGDFALTAKLWNTTNAVVQTSNPTADLAWWSVAGLPQIADGVYKATSKITVGPLILTGPASRQGAGFVRLIGVANANATVKIKAVTPGSSKGLKDVAVVSADAKGDFQVDVYVNQTTTFLATTYDSSTSANLYSPSVTVMVTSNVVTAPTPKIKSYSAKALGKGKVTLTVAGNGNTNSRVTVYQLVGKKFVKVAYLKVNSKGVASVTLKPGKGTKSYRFVYANASKTAVKNVSVKVK